MLPVGVVIPKKNSMPYLQAHLENISTWLDLVEQVVVVDSFSDDGTVEFIKKKLNHPNILFENHPPGLYASWNYAIGKIKSRFCYISTVGDSLTRFGIEHLVHTALDLRCDVLVSRPNFVNEFGNSIAGPQWPLDEIINISRLKKPVIISPAIMVACAFKNTGGALTGSCASDLFLTKALQEHPFPTSYGTAGDGPWGMQNASSLAWAVTPVIISTFLRHPPAASVSEVKTGGVLTDYPKRALQLMSSWHTISKENYLPNINEYLKNLSLISIQYEQAQTKYNKLRQELWPWILRPSVWALRIHRNSCRNQCQKILKLIIDLYMPNHR